MTDVLVTFLNNAQTPTGGVFVLSCLILLSYSFIVRQIKPDSPFNDHIIIITGACLIVPAVMFLGVAKIISAEALTGILGTIVGYFFQPKNRGASG